MVGEGSSDATAVSIWPWWLCSEQTHGRAPCWAVAVKALLGAAVSMPVALGQGAPWQGGQGRRCLAVGTGPGGQVALGRRASAR